MSVPILVRQNFWKDVSKSYVTSQNLCCKIIAQHITHILDSPHLCHVHRWFSYTPKRTGYTRLQLFREGQSSSSSKKRQLFCSFAPKVLFEPSQSMYPLCINKNRCHKLSPNRWKRMPPSWRSPSSMASTCPWACSPPWKRNGRPRMSWWWSWLPKSLGKAPAKGCRRLLLLLLFSTLFWTSQTKKLEDDDFQFKLLQCCVYFGFNIIQINGLYQAVDENPQLGNIIDYDFLWLPVSKGWNPDSWPWSASHFPTKSWSLCLSQQKENIQFFWN